MQLFGKNLHHNTDWSALVEGCISGDRKAQKALYDALSGKMYAV